MTDLSDFFVLRTPTLPFDELLALADGLEAPSRPHDAEATARDRSLLRERLRGLVDRPEVREAIFVSSPQLEDLIETWLADPDTERGRQCERALIRYSARMSARPVPFGLFAGVSTGTIADDTRLEIGGRDAYRRHTRLDGGYLLDVVEALLARPQSRENALYRTNPSLYRAAGRARFVRRQRPDDDQLHVLVSVRDTPVLAAVLARAAEGATVPELERAVTERGVAPERAAQYVAALVERGAIVPELGVQLTGGDAVLGLASAAPELSAVREQLAELDSAGLGTSRARYGSIAHTLADLVPRPSLEHLFQVDLTKPSPRLALGRDVLAEIQRGGELLRRYGGRWVRDAALERFVEAFNERYDGCAVPLLEALDPDIGVGFGDQAADAPLLAGIADGARPTLPWGRREEHLLGRVLELERAGRDELRLTANDLELLETGEPPPLPDAYALGAVVSAPSDTDLARGRFDVLVMGPGGPSGAELFGRFCHADDALRHAVEEHLRAEEALDPGAVFAEIVHLARPRDVSVSTRPVLRPYEISCLGRSGAPADRQLPLDDLLVVLEGSRIVLRSQRLGRRVVPRLTSAHNYTDWGVAVYRFLCSIQGDGFAREGFWGALGGLPFLPRVRSGRVILERARWRLPAEELGPPGDADADFRRVQEWRRTRRVPRFVVLAHPGLGLPVDLDNILAVDSFVHAVRGGGVGDVVELFPTPDALCVHGPEGRFTHELVVPLVRDRAPASPESRPASVPVRRTFPPGSDWLYVRLYTGELTADAVLTDELAPLQRDFAAAGLVDRWHFLRYRDPHFHLRVRFHGEAALVQADVRPRIETLCADLVERGVVWRVEFGTYDREVGHYGGPEAIEPAEAAFHADSDAVVSILGLLGRSREDQEERWRLGLYGVHALLLDLGLEPSERLALARHYRDNGARVLGWGDAVFVHTGRRFRHERQALQQLLDPDALEPGPLEPGLEIFRARSAALAPVAEELRRVDAAHRLTTTVPRIAGNLMHMHLNRLLRGNNLAQEAVICDFLARLYESSIRRVERPRVRAR